MSSCLKRTACPPARHFHHLLRMSTERASRAGRYALAFLSLTLIAGMCSCAKVPANASHKDLYVRDLSDVIHDTLPVRGIRGPLALHRDGDAYECTMCHETFDEAGHDAALEGEHADITFDHGRNVRCLNCHNTNDPDSFVGWGDVKIPNDQPTELCSKCHGPHYKEWSLGIHGRLNYYWDPRMGEQVRRDCIQCHNPHKPKFDLMKPEPPPVLTRFDLQAQGESGHE